MCMDVIGGVLSFKSGKNKRAYLNVDEAKVVCLDRNVWRKMILA